MASIPWLWDTGRPSMGKSAKARRSHTTVPFCRRRSRFSGLTTQPPPVAITSPDRWVTWASTFVSKSRKAPSPYFLKYAGMDMPAAFWISSSQSTNSRFNFCAIFFPTVVLPAPGMPMRTIFSICCRMAVYTRSRVSRGMSRPVKISLARTAWATSIHRPLSQGIPAASASRMSRVRDGL